MSVGEGSGGATEQRGRERYGNEWQGKGEARNRSAMEKLGPEMF